MLTAELPGPGAARRDADRFQPAGHRLVTACIVLAVVLGVFFRFYHIDRKVYWEDETYTSLHALGLTEAQVVARAPHLADAAALRAVMFPAGPLTTSVGDTVHSLAVEDPQHPPLYYIAAHIWIGSFGNSVAVIRTLSAIVGVIALPCMYWLCLELFGSALAAWIGVALFALSPIAVLFSQEAREYILWSCVAVVMSAAFLRALRRSTIGDWTAYAVAIAVSLYVFPVSALLVAANLATAVVFGHRHPRALAAPLVASALGGAAFLPWLAVLYANAHKVEHAMGVTTAPVGSKLDAIRQFIALFKLNLVDFNVAGRNAAGAAVSLATVALLVYAAVVVARRAPRRASVFIAMTALFSAAPFVVLDIGFGQHFTANPRYFMPFYLSLDLLLAAAIASMIAAPPEAGRLRNAGLALFAVVIGLRVASCGLSARADTWWSKYGERSIEVARAINESDRPLLVSTEFMERPLSLSTYLEPKVRLQLRPRCYLCDSAASAPFDLKALARTGAYSDVFVLGSPATVQREINAAILVPPGGTRSHCIDDALDEQNGCGAGQLHLWPT